jgi:four helix bundle protein
VSVVLQFLHTRQAPVSKTLENSDSKARHAKCLQFRACLTIKGSFRNYAHGQEIRDRTFAFACRVVSFCQKLYEQGGVSRLMAPQLVSCSTSTAAMLEEARAAEGDADFLSKTCVSLKECRECWMRLRVCGRCKLGPAAEAQDLVREGSELVAIIATIVQNKRRNMKAKAARRGRARFANLS